MFENEKFLNLIKRYHENKLAHAFLFETNDIDKCYKDLLLFLKHINCNYEYNSDCSNEECNICTLFDKGNLPSFILIKPDGTQIKKSQIEEMMERFSTKPIYSQFNMYVILEADNFNASSANAILKFLEEPSPNILGFYITTNKMNVISTIRSRCQEISINYEENIDYMKSLDNIVSLLNGIYNNKESLLFVKEIALDFYEERKDWISYFTDMIYFVNTYYKDRRNDYGITLFKDFNDEQIVKLLLLIETVLKYLKSNGNIELILDKFVIEMRNIYA